ncbi:MAG: hypothetical protein AAF596_07720 [Planctomycetota bacterium]
MKLCIWTNEITRHLADNGVTVEEFEAVLNDAASEPGISRSSGLPFVVGERNGRLLLCVFDPVDDVWVVPVTSYEIDQ